jgi:ankyrin repeat protein
MSITPFLATTLPEAILLNLLLYFLTPRDVIQFSSINKKFYTLLTKSNTIDHIWTWYIKTWTITPSVNNNTETITTTTTLLLTPKNQFITNYYSRRSIPFHPAGSIQSIYNADYISTIHSITLCVGGIVQIQFDTRGNNSLGPLQPAQDSKLFYQSPTSTHNPNPTQHLYRTQSNLTQMEIDTDNRRRGQVVYQLQHEIELNSKLFFQFGSGGYSTIEICKFTPEFIQEYHLSHIMKGKWIEKFILYNLIKQENWNHVRNFLPLATTEQLQIKINEISYPVNIFYNNNLKSLIYVACCHNAPIDVIEYLIVQLQQQLNPNNNNNNTITEEGCLNIAIGKGSTEVVELLLKYGANPNYYTSIYDGGPLYVALQAYPIKIEILTLLVRYGCNLNYGPSNSSSSPLSILLRRKDVDGEIFRFLLDYGADPNTISQGYSPVQIAAAVGCSVDILTTLFEYGAKNEGNSTFQLSQQFQHQQISPLSSPLELAIYYKHKHLIPILTSPPQPCKKIGEGLNKLVLLVKKG